MRETGPALKLQKICRGGNQKPLVDLAAGIIKVERIIAHQPVPGSHIPSLTGITKSPHTAKTASEFLRIFPKEISICAAEKNQRPDGGTGEQERCRKKKEQAPYRIQEAEASSLPITVRLNGAGDMEQPLSDELAEYE